MLLIFKNNCKINDYLIEGIIKSKKLINCKTSHKVPFMYNKMFLKKYFTIDDLQFLNTRKLKLWLQFRKYYKLHINNVETRMYFQFVKIFHLNNKTLNANMCYLSAFHNCFELFQLLEPKISNVCYVLSCLNAIEGKSLKILKYIYEKYKLTQKIWIKSIKGLTIINNKYIIDKKNNYENTDWSVLYYANISNQNDAMNLVIKNYLISIECPLNENLSFKQ